MQFCKDFDIFPDLITKAKLMKIFLALSQSKKLFNYLEFT